MAAPAPAPNRDVGLPRPLDRLLGLVPLAIAIVWVAGVARFRDYELQPLHWLLLVAFAFAMQVIGARMRAQRPLPPMPSGARAVPLAALVATIVGAAAAVAGGALEWVAPRYFPTEVSWGLRTLWHVACAFGASYCLFLRRLLRVLPA
ncbi:MAG: hypothetical protein ACON4Z_13050 [Planctomycetota bacterium]